VRAISAPLAARARLDRGPAPPQQWHAELIGHTTYNGYASGIFHLINDGTGMCLDDRDGRTSDRSPIQQYTRNDTSTTMQWMMGTGDGNGYNPLLNMRALQNGGSACLDVAGGSYEAGRPGPGLNQLSR
jgi:hypothetical protein